MTDTDTESPRSGNPLGIILGLGALGLLLVLLMFRSSPTNDLPVEQGPMAAALVNSMMTNGVLVNYDCPTSTAWVNRPVWEKSNAAQKRDMILGLATICDTRNAGYRMSIVDYASRLEIAGFDGKTVRISK